MLMVVCSGQETDIWWGCDGDDDDSNDDRVCVVISFPTLLPKKEEFCTSHSFAPTTHTVVTRSINDTLPRVSLHHLHYAHEGYSISSVFSSSSSSCISSSVGVSFSPVGLLTPYHIGVAEQLRRIGLIDVRTNLSGSSGGALAAACSALGVDSQNTLLGTASIAKLCRDRGNWANLRQGLDVALENILPPDAHLLLNERPGMTCVAYRQVFPEWSPQLVSSFSSREDLKDVWSASCTIPFYFSGYPAVHVREVNKDSTKTINSLLLTCTWMQSFIYFTLSFIQWCDGFELERYNFSTLEWMVCSH